MTQWFAGRTSICAVTLAVLVILSGSARAATTAQNQIAEITFHSAKPYDDPFGTVELDVAFTAPDGARLVVPGFWAGGDTWRVRYASGQIGAHRYETTCSDPANAGLHGQNGTVEITAYTGSNPLYRHGPMRVTADKRHFEHADGTPFFWLGDTWWMGLCHRLEFPGEFSTLEADRVKKGFTVVQIVAGLYPDMPAFDERGANEAGFPWDPDYKSIRPEYFDKADARLLRLVDAGLAPCIVGAWGYFAPWMGEAKLKQHWRYLVARYGALPVFWCIAGEANLPYYLVKDFPYDDRTQVTTWTNVARYVRGIDPYRRPLTLHPTGLGRLSARGACDDPALLDFDMLQTGHGDRDVLVPSMKVFNWSYAEQPTMPVLNSEVSYEMLLDKITAAPGRLVFWADMLSGAAGHTYGGNGIWQVNQPGQAHGKSPHGGNYGTISWQEAMHLPGSTQLSQGKQLIEQYDWQHFEPHPEWASLVLADPGKPEEAALNMAYAAGIPKRVRLIFAPTNVPITVHGIEPGCAYHAGSFDATTGARKDLGAVEADAAGNWKATPGTEIVADWVLVLEATGGAKTSAG